MSCSSSKNTLRGKYNKIINLQKPTSYTVDSKGNVKPKYK